MMKKMGWIMVGFSAASGLAAAGLTIHLGWCTWYAGWDDGLSDLVEDLGLKTMWAGALPLVAVVLMTAGVTLITRKREK